MSRNIFRASEARHLHYFILVGLLILLGNSCDAASRRKSGVVYNAPDQCPEGYFGRFCLRCECSGVTSDCQAIKLVYNSVRCEMQISVLDSTWKLADSNGTVSTLKPAFFHDSDTLYSKKIVAHPHENSELFWLAPEIYSGNRLSSYGTNFTFNVTWWVNEDKKTIFQPKEPFVILISNQGLQIGYYGVENVIMATTNMVPLEEFGWFHVRADGNSSRIGQEYIDRPVARSEMLEVLANLKHLLIRTRYRTDQLFSALWKPSLLVGTPSFFGAESLVEQCHCPKGYSGLSCESCASGYTKILNDPLNNDVFHQCV